MKKILGIGLVVVMSGCASTKEVATETDEVFNTDPIEVVAVETVDVIAPERPVYRETETVLTDLIHTRLEVDFIWEKSQMNGLATITASPHFYPSDSLILDAKGMEIYSVKMNGQDLEYRYENDFLNINLGKTFTRDQEYTVVIDYLAKPDEYKAKGSAAITDAKGLYFINPSGENPNKMTHLWTQGETEASSVWFPTIDSPNAKTTQEIFMTVDEGYTTLSNGKLISSKKVTRGKRTDHWKQDLPHSPYLFMMAVGDFAVVKDSYTNKEGKKIEVNYFVEKEWEDDAQGIFGETPEMIGYFSELLGVEYPWDKYSQIVVRDYVSGAMENTGAVIFGDYVYRNERELLDGNDQSTIAHELFHHWFGDLVTCESWSNLPLNESFANYSQYLWDEHRYGIDEADYNAELEASYYYQGAAMQGYHNLIWFDYKDKEDMFDLHSYNKGGRILHMLRNYLGDDAFFAGINLYLTTNKFKAAEFHQLRLAFEEVSGEDLNWFFNQWFLGSGHPNLEFSQERDTVNHVLKVTVKQKQDFTNTPLYKLPFDIAIYDDNGETIHAVVLDEVEETFSIPFSGQLKGFVYDHEQMLLGQKEESKTDKEYVYQYYNGKRFAARRDAIKEAAGSTCEGGSQLLLDGLKDPFWKIRELALGKISRLNDTDLQKAVAIATEIAKNDPRSSVRVVAMNALKKELMDEELIALYTNRIENDKSYNVISNALRNLAEIDDAKALALAKTLENEESSKMIVGVAQVYAQYGGADKYEYLIGALENPKVQGFDKLGLLNSFTKYIVGQDADLILSSKATYENQAKNGGFYMNMFLPKTLEYICNQSTMRITELDSSIVQLEKDGDVVQMHAAIKERDKLKTVVAEFDALKDKLNESKEGHGLIIHEEE